MSEILVSHPGLQHAHQLGWALYDRGLLQAFWSGIPVANPGVMMQLWLPKIYAERLKSVPIPLELRRHPLIFQALLRVGRLLPRGMSGGDYDHRIFHFYDWWVSQQIQHLKPKVVVAYENAAYHTFRAAKTIGARCVLDAASLHHSVGTRCQVVKPSHFRDEINRRKDLEVELADMILTCSPLAAESYQAAGVEASKLKPILLGADLPKICNVWQAHQQPLRFIFAGGIRYLKAIDVILAVFRRLHSERLPAEVVFVGGLVEAKWLSEIQQTPNAEYHVGVSQTQLFGMLTEADCLLLPSRFDSFGMVVAEAMACGTPAIVSTQTGAKAMIEQFPQSGWIVECDEDALYDCVKTRIQNREELFAAREAALAASQHFTWQAYRARVGQFIEEWMK